MNDCMWAAFYLFEEGDKFRSVVMYQQIHKNTDDH